MTPRIDYFRVSPKAIQAMMQLQKYVNDSGLEHSLLALVKMRASLINGCAYCLDMHSKDARSAGETEQRLYLLDAWRETSLYSARERAPSNGPRHSPSFTKAMRRTACLTRCASTSAKQSSWT